MNGLINFRTNLGTTIMIRSIEVKPKSCALIKLIYVESFDVVEKHKFLMEGDDYKAWGNNDDYIGEYCVKKLLGDAGRIIDSDSDYVAEEPVNEV